MVFFGQSVLSRSLNTYIQNTSLLHQTVISGSRSLFNLETPDNSLNGQFYYSHPPPTNGLSSIFPFHRDIVEEEEEKEEREIA